jgi:hypothetical protein
MGKKMDLNKIEREEKMNRLRLPLWLYPILFITAFIVSFGWDDYTQTPAKASALFGLTEDITIYEIYPISLGEGISEEDVEIIKDELGKIAYAGVNRFEFE